MPRLVAILVASLVALSGVASASIEWDVRCDAARAQFEISVGIFNQYVQEGDVAGYELLFEQSAIGTCEAAEIFATRPLHAPLTYADYSFTRPAPEANRYYRFRVLMRRPDGTVYDVGFPAAPSWFAASCGEAVAARGMLTGVDDFGYATVELCAGSCPTWPCTSAVSMVEIPEEQWLPLVGSGIPVDLHGRYHLYPMPGGPCLSAESLVLTSSADCAPIPVQGATWGGLKGRYR